MKKETILCALLIVVFLVVMVQAETATVFTRNPAFRWIQVIPTGEVDGFYSRINVGRLHYKCPMDQPAYDYNYDELRISVSSFSCAKVVIGFTTSSGSDRIAIFQLHNVSYDSSCWRLAVTQSDMKVTLQTSVGLEDTTTGYLTGMDFKYPDNDLLTHPPAHVTYYSKSQFNPGDWVWLDTPADGEGAYTWPDIYGEWRFGGKYHFDPVCQIWRGDENRYEWGGLVVASFTKVNRDQNYSERIVLVRLYTPDDCSDVVYPAAESSPRHHLILVDGFYNKYGREF